MNIKNGGWQSNTDMQVSGDHSIYNNNDITGNSGYIRFYGGAGGQLILHGGTTNALRIDSNLNFQNGGNLYVGGQYAMSIYAGGISNLSGPTLRMNGPISLEGTNATIASPKDIEMRIDMNSQYASSKFVWTYGTGTELMRLDETGNLGLGIINNINTRFSLKSIGATSSTYAIKTFQNDGVTETFSVTDNGQVAALDSYWLNGAKFIHTTGSQNLFIGRNAGISNGGVMNTFIGAYIGSSASGSYNTGIGSNVMPNLTTGQSNIALGDGALLNLTTGSSNISVGYNTKITTGSNTIMVGGVAAQVDGTSSDWICIGYSSLISAAVGTSIKSIVIGGTNSGAVNATTAGLRSVSIGYETRNYGYNDVINIGNESYANGNNSVTIGTSLYSGQNSHLDNSILLGGGLTPMTTFIYGTHDGSTVAPATFTFRTANPYSIIAGPGDIAGHTLKLAGGLSTGAGIGGDIILSTSNTGTTGITLNTLSDRLTIKGGTGNIGIQLPTPTAKLHIAPGTNAPGTSALKLTSGPLLTAPEVGSVEFLTDRLYFTQTTGAIRQSIAYLSDVTSAINAASNGGGGVYYVSKTGNDSTAIKGNLSKPWLTIDAALIAANSLNSSMVFKWITGSVSVVINGATYTGTDAASLATAISAGPTLSAVASGNNVTVTTSAASFICDPNASTGGITTTSRTITETATIVIYGGDYNVTSNLFKDGVNWAAIGVVNITGANSNGAHIFDVGYRSAIGTVIDGAFNFYATGINSYVFNYLISSTYYSYTNSITISFEALTLNSAQSSAIFIYSDLNTISNFDFKYLRANATGAPAIYVDIVSKLQNIFIECLESKSTTHEGAILYGVVYSGMCTSSSTSSYSLICKGSCKFSGILNSNCLLHLQITGGANQIEQVGSNIYTNITGDSNTIISPFYKVVNTGKGNEINAMGECIEVFNTGDLILRNFKGNSSVFWIYGYSLIRNAGGNLLIKDFVCDGTTGMFMQISGGVVNIDTDLDILSNNISLFGGTLIVNKRLRALYTANNDYGNADLIVWTGGNLVLRPGSVLIKSSHVDANIISSDIARNVNAYSVFANQDFRIAIARKDNIAIGGTVQAGEVYTETVNGTSYSYTALAGDTATNVVSGLISAISAPTSTANVNTTNNGNNFDIYANTPGNNYTLTVSKTAGTGTIAATKKRNNNSVITSVITGASINIDTTNLI